MEALSIILNAEGQWTDAAEKGIVEPVAMALAALPAGTSGGNPSIAIRCDLPDGQVVIAQTTLRLLLTAADAFKARYGDPR